MQITSKLPETGTTIFTVMSRLAQDHGAINLGQGFPDFDCVEDLKERISHYLHMGKNQYAPMAGIPALRQALSSKLLATFGRRVDPDAEITVTAGATQALFTAILAFVNRGDEVILIEPAYDSYRPGVLLAGGIPVSYELEAPLYRIDWDALGSMITPRTRMIITNTPHNPIGKVFKPEDMAALDALTADTDIIILSDEVYEHLIYDGCVHQSVCRYPGLYRRSVAVYSFGKTFHATGWKVGYAVGPPELMAEFRKVHQFNVFSVNSFIQYALADHLSDPENYTYLRVFFQSRRDLLLQEMAGSRFVPIKCEGTYFQLFDYSAISDLDDNAFCRQLTTSHGVAAIPVSVFYTSGRQDQVIRLCFAKNEQTLELASKRLCAI